MTLHTPFITNKVQRPLGSEGALYLDFDGVLGDYLSGYRQDHFEQYGVWLDPKGPSSFQLRDWLGASSDEEASAMLMKFNSGESGGFRNIPPLPGAKEAISAAHAAGLEMHILTSASREKKPAELRRLCAHDHFGPVFKSIICIDMHEDKAPYLASFAPGFWVEDNFDNAMKGVAHGHQTFLVRSSHNRKYEAEGKAYPFTWVDSVKDAVDFILQ